LIAATAAEVEEIVDELAPELGDRLVQVAGDNAKELTSAWQQAQAPGKLIVGTPRVAMWQVGGLALAVVLEEGRRSMKDRQTPTIHVRDFMTTRARSEGFGLVFVGPTPSLEILARGATVSRFRGRPWGLVEIVDRNEDPPGSGQLSDRVLTALRAVVGRGGDCFVFTPWRGEGTDAVPDRIVKEINRKLGSEDAGVHPTTLPIAVGTERDLAGLDQVDLAVAADSDGLLLGSNYRNPEEALRVLARLGDALRPGSGRRMMVQTSMPDSSLSAALRRGDSIPYLENLLVERARQGLPPASEMLVLEIRGGLASDLGDQVKASLAGVEVIGPAEVDGGLRWLLTGDLSSVRVQLRGQVQHWRDSGLTVRIDADPIDL
jgi:primosomal protein N'